MLQKHILISAFGFALMGSSVCAAQVLLTDDPPEVSRQEWQAHVRASRERADIMRRERKGFVSHGPTPQEIAKEASRRALEDDSLLPGDIVSTSSGMYQFRGVPGRERSPDDFVRIR